jgi:hypothetical protein
MKFKMLFAFISTAIFTHATWATPQLPDEQICPRVEVIKTSGLTFAENEGGGRWAAAHQSHYNTAYLWDFLISNAVFSKTTQFDADAMRKALQALQSLRFKEIVIGQNDIFCDYVADGNITAIATVRIRSL